LFCTNAYNTALYVFCRKKAQLKKKRGVTTINEQMLFHGTSNEFVEAICIHNFDWRINGMHAAVYGKGKYFFHIQQFGSLNCSTLCVPYRMFFVMYSCVFTGDI